MNSKHLSLFRDACLDAMPFKKKNYSWSKEPVFQSTVAAGMRDTRGKDSRLVVAG